MRNYPEGPGANWRDTSLRAADEIEKSALNLRYHVLSMFVNHNDWTTHELAGVLNKPVSSVQPRVSELAALGLIVDSGIRRKNEASGKRAIAWKLAPSQLKLL